MPPIIQVEIVREEGPISDETKGKRTFSGDDAEPLANQFLRLISETAPKHGGYDKTEVTVTLVTGDVMKCRFDIKHHSCPDSDLDVRKHLIDTSTFPLYPERFPWVQREIEKDSGLLARIRSGYTPADLAKCERILNLLSANEINA